MPAPFIIADEEGRQKALAEIARLDLDDKRWEITVKRDREGRTLRQNRLYFSWVQEVVDHVSDTTGYEKHEVHKFFKENFLEPGRDIQIKGLTARADVTTTTLNAAEMSAYMDSIYRWVNTEFGFALRLPPVIVEEGYAGPPRQANGADDDWGIVAADIIALIDQAPNADRLEEITALRERELTAMEENAPAHYTRVMQAMEVRGLDLDRKDPAAQSPQGDPVQHPLEAG